MPESRNADVTAFLSVAARKASMPRVSLSASLGEASSATSRTKKALDPLTS